MKKCFIASLLLITLQPHLRAQWNGDPTIADNPVSTFPVHEYGIMAVTDGAGGSIMVWQAYNSIYAQRKTVSGSISWSSAATPVHIFSDINHPTLNDVVPDGSGGAYITWQKYLTDTTSDLYLQRISSDGVFPFSVTGIKVNLPDQHHHSDAQLSADAGGVIIAWSNRVINTLNIPSYAQVFTQRYNLNGAPQWGGQGIQVSTVAGLKTTPQITSDGGNGAFIAFTDYRDSTRDISGDFINGNIYAQHLSSTGNRLWGATDAVVSAEAFNQSAYDNAPLPAKSMIADNAGGFIIVYDDYRSNNQAYPNLYAQRLNNNGISIWAQGGVPLSNPSGIYKSYLQLANDNNNGVVASWDEFDFNVGFVHAQRITGAGIPDWGINGIVVSPVADQDFSRTRTSMAADGSGNYVFTWALDNPGEPKEIKGQKLNNSGVAQWNPGGIKICTNQDAAPRSPVLVRSSKNTMLTAWEDSRNYATNGQDIYAARIDTSGILITVVNCYTTADGDWSNPAIWSGNVLPPATANIIIRHKVAGNLNTTCSSLKIEAPGMLTINTGINITVLQ